MFKSSKYSNDRKKKASEVKFSKPEIRTVENNVKSKYKKSTKLTKSYVRQLIHSIAIPRTGA